MQDLATAFRLGNEVPRDDNWAVVWYHRAAEFGDRNAKANLKRLGVIQ